MLIEKHNVGVLGQGSKVHSTYFHIININRSSEEDDKLQLLLQTTMPTIIQIQLQYTSNVLMILELDQLFGQ